MLTLWILSRRKICQVENSALLNPIVYPKTPNHKLTINLATEDHISFLCKANPCSKKSKVAEKVEHKLGPIQTATFPKNDKEDISKKSESEEDEMDDLLNDEFSDTDEDENSIEQQLKLEF